MPPGTEFGDGTITFATDVGCAPFDYVGAGRHGGKECLGRWPSVEKFGGPLRPLLDYGVGGRFIPTVFFATLFGKVLAGSLVGGYSTFNVLEGLLQGPQGNGDGDNLELWIVGVAFGFQLTPVTEDGHDTKGLDLDAVYVEKVGVAVELLFIFSGVALGGIFVGKETPCGGELEVAKFAIFEGE